jgi:hypothetical protein
MAKKKHIKRSIRQHALWAAVYSSRQRRLYSEFASLVHTEGPINWKRVMAVMEEIDGKYQYGTSVTVEENPDTREMRAVCTLDVPISYIGGLDGLRDDRRKVDSL